MKEGTFEPKSTTAQIAIPPHFEAEENTSITQAITNIQTSGLASHRIFRKLQQRQQLSKKEKILAGLLICERMFGLCLIFCQAVFTGGLPASNKVSSGYDRSSDNNNVNLNNWLHSPAPLYFVSSTVANAFFSLGLFGAIEKEFDRLKYLVCNKKCGEISIKFATYILGFAAAFFDSGNARQSLEEWTICGNLNKVLTYLSHAAMTLAYSEGLNISNQDCKNIRQCFTGYNSIYDIATIPFVLLRPYQNASQMVTKIPENSDKLSIILASLKILGALLAFTSLTIKGLAKIREPVTKSVLYLPKKAINCFAMS
jgi:hypothetical protein